MENIESVAKLLGWSRECVELQIVLAAAVKRRQDAELAERIETCQSIRGASRKTREYRAQCAASERIARSAFETALAAHRAS